MSSKKIQKILIIKPSALGDIALTLTALTSLRKSFPDAEISWLVRKEFAPLLERCFSEGGVHLIDLPVDYSDNNRVLVDELKEKVCLL